METATAVVLIGWIKVQSAKFLVPGSDSESKIKMPKCSIALKQPGCIFGRNLEPGSQFFQSELNLGDSGIKSNPGRMLVQAS